MRGRGIGRDGYEVWIEGEPAGWVTSGSPAPTLNRNIGMCYLPADRAVPGQAIQIMIRNQPVELLPPVDSMDGIWNDFERMAVETKLSAAIVGSNATVKAGLEKLVSETAADEVIVVTDTYEHADRLRSYERVAEVAKDLESPAEATTHHASHRR